MMYKQLLLIYQMTYSTWIQDTFPTIQDINVFHHSKLPLRIWGKNDIVFVSLTLCFQQQETTWQAQYKVNRWPCLLPPLSMLSVLGLNCVKSRYHWSILWLCVNKWMVHHTKAHLLCFLKLLYPLSNITGWLGILALWESKKKPLSYLHFPHCWYFWKPESCGFSPPPHHRFSKWKSESSIFYLSFSILFQQWDVLFETGQYSKCGYIINKYRSVMLLANLFSVHFLMKTNTEFSFFTAMAPPLQGLFNGPI